MVNLSPAGVQPKIADFISERGVHFLELHLIFIKCPRGHKRAITSWFHVDHENIVNECVIKWKNGVPHLGSGIMPVACDINGDGKDEIIVSNQIGVYCIGNNAGKTSILWKYLAADCGPAVVADIDSDGFVKIMTATANGQILVLDK